MTVYSSPLCAPCIALKRWLDYKQVEYKLIDITKDSSALQGVIRLTGGMQVPVVRKDSSVVVGLNYPAIAKLI